MPRTTITESSDTVTVEPLIECENVPKLKEQYDYLMFHLGLNTLLWSCDSITCEVERYSESTPGDFGGGCQAEPPEHFGYIEVRKRPITIEITVMDTGDCAEVSIHPAAEMYADLHEWLDVYLNEVRER